MYTLMLDLQSLKRIKAWTSGKFFIVVAENDWSGIYILNWELSVYYLFRIQVNLLLLQEFSPLRCQYDHSWYSGCIPSFGILRLSWLIFLVFKDNSLRIKSWLHLWAILLLLRLGYIPFFDQGHSLKAWSGSPPPHS